MTKRIIGIVVVAIIAACFYAAAWTSSENTVSMSLCLTGIILSLQAAATVLIVENT